MIMKDLMAGASDEQGTFHRAGVIPGANPGVRTATNRMPLQVDLSGRDTEEVGMSNPWKYAAIGIVVIALTAATSSVMTAYVMRPARPETGTPAQEPDAQSPDVPDVKPATSESHETISTVAPRHVAARRTMRVAATRAEDAQVPAPAECASGAIADGGKGAGKGALIGAGVGAVAGGAEKECGTILGAPGVASTGNLASSDAHPITIDDVR
jgi:hypothetical protein